MMKDAIFYKRADLIKHIQLGSCRGVETILKVEGHDCYEVKNGGPGVYPRKNFLQTTPFKLRENDTTPSYYA